MLDFPNPPLTVGQTFNSGSGAIYVWDGVAWSIATSQTKTARTRNLVINPCMAVSQENGDVTSGMIASSGAYFTADQWLSTWTLPGTAAVQRGRPAFDNGSDFISASIGTASASLAAGSSLQHWHNIEGLNLKDLQWGTVNAKQAVLRFSFYSSVAGTFTATVRNGAADRTYLVNFTAPAGSWKIYTFVIPGDTIGTWPKDNSRGMYLGICLAAGTTLQGIAGWQAGNFLQAPGATNFAATAGAVCYFTDVGFYVDPDNTGLPPPFHVPDYAVDLNDCQRYYTKLTGLYLTGWNNASNSIYESYNLPSTMRTNPSIAFANLANASNVTNLVAAGIITPTTLTTGITISATGAGLITFDMIAGARM